MEILGIDVGGTGIKAARVDIDSGNLTTERFRVETPQPPSIESITKVIAAIVADMATPGSPVGLAFPARIKNGIVSTATNIVPAFLGTNLASMLSTELNCDVVVLNDADAAGIAEVKYGAGRGHGGVILTVTVGTGLGTALFVDGTLVPGTELGHIKLKGKIAEEYASNKTRKDKEMTWKQWANRFQRYLDRMEFLFAPDLIIIGGGISKPEKKVEYFDRLSTSADLATATLGNNAGIVGAAVAAAETYEAVGRSPAR